MTFPVDESAQSYHRRDRDETHTGEDPHTRPGPVGEGRLLILYRIHHPTTEVLTYCLSTTEDRTRYTLDGTPSGARLLGFYGGRPVVGRSSPLGVRCREFPVSEVGRSGPGTHLPS